MKANIIVTVFISLLIVSQGCELNEIEYGKITPGTFFKTEKDAQLAVAALYSGSITSGNFFNANPYNSFLNSDIAAGDMATCSYTQSFERLRNHEYTQDLPLYTDRWFRFYKDITEARLVVKQLDAMTIPEEKKRQYIAEANAIAGWKAYLLYDLYGTVPFPTDEMMAEPLVTNYPSRPTNEEFVSIIETFFSQKNDLPPANFGSNFGRINKNVANMILIKLYMLEAGRTGDESYWTKAKTCAEEIISTGLYRMLSQYSDVFAKANKYNNEIIYAPSSTYETNPFQYHAEALTNNYPCRLNRTAGAWGGYKLLWSFYDTFDQNDLRLSGIAASYVTDAGELINRQNPKDARHGLVVGPLAVKYDVDDTPRGYVQGHNSIVYRYADVILSMAEILNELGENSAVNAPVMRQTAKDGSTYESDGGNTSLSFINAIRVRAGLQPFSGLSGEQLRDSILMERSHELYMEGSRRADLIRYQRITNGAGYKKYDENTHKFLYPIPNSFILEYKGNLEQNPGYN
jgi:starch-binding outer membrane protein, SusD/RagB family